MKSFLKGIVASIAAAPSAVASAHAVGPLGSQILGWSNKQISAVIAGGTPIYYPSRTQVIEGKECLIGNMFNVNVRDDYAFNIDEAVELELEVPPMEYNTKVFVFYDGNAASLTTFDPNGVNEPMRTGHTSASLAQTTIWVDSCPIREYWICRNGHTDLRRTGVAH